MAPTCSRLQRAPVAREAMPWVSTRTEKVRMKDSAVNMAVNAPATTATIHRLISLPTMTARGTLEAIDHGEQAGGGGDAASGRGDHDGQQGVVKFQHQAFGIAGAAAGEIRAPCRSISGVLSRAFSPCSSARVGSSGACAMS